MNKLTIILLLLFFSCEENYKKQIANNYFIRGVNSKEFIDLGYGNTSTAEGLIDYKIIKIFWDNNYILAVRQPLGKNRKLEYYILKIIENDIKSASKNILGPLSKEDFDFQLKKNKIDVENMDKEVFY